MSEMKNFTEGIKHADRDIRPPSPQEIEMFLRHHYDLKDEMQYYGREISDDVAYFVIKSMIEDDQITSLGIRSIEFFFKHIQDEDLELGASLKKKLDELGIVIET